MSNTSGSKKLTLTSETLRALTPAELDTANGGTFSFSWLGSQSSCVNCFNVGGNAPGINVQNNGTKPRRHAPRSRGH